MSSPRAAWVAPLVLAFVAGACAGAGGTAPAGEPGADEAARSGPPTSGDVAATAPAAARPDPGAPDGAGAVVLTGRVTSVVDGDTVKVEVDGFETTVRLVGIDTPETRHPTEPVQCFGPEASRRAERLLPTGRRVRLVSDPTQDTRDRYGRLIAYVNVAGRSGPTGSVNLSLVRSGHAKVYIHDGVPFRHATTFLRAEERAREEGRGLWGPPCRGDTDAPDPSGATPERRAPRPRPGATAPAPTAGCDPRYVGACIAPHPPDVNCNEIPDRDFRVVGEDVHRLDVDGDGIACEG